VRMPAKAVYELLRPLLARSSAGLRKFCAGRHSFEIPDLTAVFTCFGSPETYGLFPPSWALARSIHLIIWSRGRTVARGGPIARGVSGRRAQRSCSNDPAIRLDGATTG